ncbi:uncharacterized protein Dwil_GK19721 [Drosophila willistoni]|uniref:Uncharacterized protein n=1 Tax=Drosophila willistoni TaxID=7260 RepID=B4MTE4_DROWI|nr:uncharacterized protein LOC6641493 [Drosophila willistoni]EDW75383.1 uncharacterized protein Dwil_GK19721 [Drosophila willistoni]
MAEGFKKHFNSSTIRGRANVAKATYGTFALIYLFYRVRRGSGKTPPTDDERRSESSCNCDRPREPIEPDSGVFEADPECAACRDRAERAMTEYDQEQQRRSAKAQEEEDHEGCNGHSNPPPPPPPSESPPPPPSSSGGAEDGTPPRRKCPCSERKQESPLNASQTRARFQQPQPQHHYATSEIQQARPVSALIGQAHEAVYQALRTVVSVVMSGASVVTGSHPDPDESSTREDCRCTSINYEGNKINRVDDDGPIGSDRMDDRKPQREDELHVEEEVLLPRRTAPRSCNGPIGHVDETAKPPTQSAQYHHSFSDGFAADMYFENADE